MQNPEKRPVLLRALGSMIFFSRWLQAPLYIGLILAQAVYVYQFFAEILHLVHGLIYGVLNPDTNRVEALAETDILIIVLKLVDVVMIANLLVMVIVGGYETFVSRLNLQNHPDQPEWLSHVNAGVLKVKLATALIGISSVALLTTFVELGANKIKPPTDHDIMWQVIVHLTFVASALLLALTDRITVKTAEEAKRH